MYLFQKIKDVFVNENEHDNNEDKYGNKNREKKEEKLELNELHDEIWLQKSDYKFNTEYSDVEYESRHESDESLKQGENDDDEYYFQSNHFNNKEGKQKKQHFLEVPLFNKDEYGITIKKNPQYTPYKKRQIKRKDEESELNTEEEEDETSTDEDIDEIDEPFLNLYEELRREQVIREYYNPMLKSRLWSFEFFIKYIHNLELQKTKNFYFITFGNDQNAKVYGNLKTERLYTRGYTLESGEIKYLRVPLMIWSKQFVLSYHDLNNFYVNIEMWKTNGLAFNSLYASDKKTLKEIIDMEPDNNITLSRKITEKKVTFETQRLGVYMRLSEIFEFHLALDSWWFISNSKMPNYLKNFTKFLRFRFPLNEHDWTIHSSYKSSNNFWLYPGYFCFVGTHQQLANSFFIVTVLCANSKYRYRPPILLGSCIVSLISVTEYPVFKGIVKKLTLDKTKFQQGEIVGNIKCFINSYGTNENEENLQRPTQPFSGATIVNQLNLNEHYLIIRIIKCENLAISSIDINNVNISVWVKWDGILNKTCLITKTTSPYFYQNLYFPIRFTDNKELTESVLIQNVLAMDLISRGDICFEAHNCNEIDSCIVGIVELHFADIFNYGIEDYRSLDHVTSRNYYTDNNREGFNGNFRKTDFADEYYDDKYMKKYKTIVYKNTLELMYSDLHLRNFNNANVDKTKESTITVEAFVIPPLPRNLMFQNENDTNNASVIYKSLSKRWEKDFQKFNDTYLQWFPKSIKKRRFPCISKNDFDNKIYPLCSFITSLNLPAQVSTPGPLFHWLNNIEYIEDTADNPCFTPPYFCLSYKKGTVQDHALLLCSCLKGLEYDAYVCKGTINNGRKEHYWVMTRHEEGWICFWEATNKSIIHLPQRWNNKKFLKINEILKQNEMLEKIKENNEEKYYSGEYLMNFIKYGLEELKKKEKAIKKEYDMKEENELYIQDILGEHNTKDEKVNIDELINNDEELFNNGFEVKFQKNDTFKCENILKYLLENFSNYIPIAPKLFLLDYYKTLTYVPYSSIEVVFNENQVFGNLQNHHPACILYDFENNNHWRAFLNHTPPKIKSEITVSTPLNNKISINYARDLEEEVREMIMFMRNKEGLETNFDYAAPIRNFLEMYLDLCEYKLNLDNNYNPKLENFEWNKKINVKEELNKRKYKKKIKKNKNEEGREEGKEEGREEEIEDEAEEEIEEEEDGEEDQLKQNETTNPCWSQYKNDYYPSIEAQYINKENPNFYSAYIPPAKTNINMLSKEKKQKLTDIPKDYVYGMNEEIYTKGKEEYMTNYVFAKNDKDILNNYDTRINKKNQKRFMHAVKHNRPFTEPETENHIDRKKSNSNNEISNKKKNKKCFNNNYSYETTKIPQNKFLKKYNKKFSGLKQLEKSLKKKQKIIKEELLELKMNNINWNKQLDKNSYPGFIDTQEFLLKSLSSGGTTTEKITEEELKRLLNSSDCLNQICGKLFNGYIFMPSKQIDKNNNGKKEEIKEKTTEEIKEKTTEEIKEKTTEEIKEKTTADTMEEKIEKQIQKNCNESANVQNIRLSNGSQRETYIRNETKGTKCNKKELYKMGTKNTINDYNLLLQKNSDICKKKNSYISKREESKDKEILFSKKQFHFSETHKMYIDENFMNLDNNNKLIENYKTLDLNNNNIKIGNKTYIEQSSPYPDTKGYSEPFENSPDAPLEFNYNNFTNEQEMLNNKYEVSKEKTNKIQTDNEIPLIPPKHWSRLNGTSRYVVHQVSQWNWYYAMEEQYFNWQYYKFPVAPNHTFVGFPIHFSTTNVTEIKSFLLNSSRFENIMRLSIDKITFLIYCKVYPLVGGIMSNWIFLGCIVPWMSAQERETRMKKAPKRDHRQR